MAEITMPEPRTVFPDFRKIALLAQSIQLLRGHEEGRELENWWEAAAFCQKQMANPLSALPRFRHR